MTSASRGGQSGGMGGRKFFTVTSMMICGGGQMEAHACICSQLRVGSLGRRRPALLLILPTPRPAPSPTWKTGISANMRCPLSISHLREEAEDGRAGPFEVNEQGSTACAPCQARSDATKHSPKGRHVTASPAAAAIGFALT